MPTIAKQDAIKQLTQAVEVATPDDLVEIYNELFPQHPSTEEEAAKDSRALVNVIVEHIDDGLEIQEILDLWNVIYPRHRSVWFDEEENRVHYDENNEPAHQAD